MGATKNTTKQKQELFLKAFRTTLGNISEACRAAGISRAVYYNWIGSGASPVSPKEARAFILQLEEIEETRTDFVESQQLKTIQGYTLPETKVFFVDKVTTQIVRGKPVVTREKVPVEVPGVKHVGPDTAAIKHYLQAKARGRGYGKEVTVKHKGQVGIKSIVFKEATQATPATPPNA